jgi:hypothetical protein
MFTAILLLALGGAPAQHNPVSMPTWNTAWSRKLLPRRRWPS